MNFGTLAYQLIARNHYGNLVGINDGKYTATPLDLVESGKRRVDVDKYYDIENYRPKVKSVLGLPMFLN